jgi:hypothetical protein
MLVICNGAIKSGSTWLYNILINLVGAQRPPEQYLTENSRKRTRNPCIRPDMLSLFLEKEDFHSTHYISKNHLGSKEHRDLLIDRENIYIFDIERQVRDMVVSAYFDARNRSGYEHDFRHYYWKEGRYLAAEVIRYHALWRNAGPRTCTVSYEELHADFGSEVRRVASVLGIALDQQRVDKLRDETSLGQLRKRYQDEPLYAGDKFFRKGVVGDWENHFDPAMTRDIASIEQHGIGPMDRHALLHRMQQLLRRVHSRRG